MKKVFIFILMISQAYSISITGVGSNSCAEFNTVKDAAIKEMYLQYAYGFLAGSKTDIKSVDIKAIDQYLYRYCRENPLDMYIEAANSLKSKIDIK